MSKRCHNITQLIEHLGDGYYHDIRKFMTYSTIFPDKNRMYFSINYQNQLREFLLVHNGYMKFEFAPDVKVPFNTKKAFVDALLKKGYTEHIHVDHYNKGE